MSSKKDSVLLFSTFSTPFIEADRQIMEEFAVVRRVVSRGFFTIFKILFWVPLVDVAVAWFASTYSAAMVLFATLLGKKSVVIVGGADVNVDRGMGYGLLVTRWKKCFVQYAIRNATHVHPMSRHLEERTRIVGDYQGRNIRYMSPGLDSDFWKSNDRKKNSVLTVASCSTPDRVRTKGIDILMEAARLKPDIAFHVIGIDLKVIAQMEIDVPPNVTVDPPMDHKQLLSHYQHATVYCQPSRIESFSFALAEGMLCECIPVATDVGGIPEVAGMAGFLVPPEDPEALASVLNEALNAKATVGQAARRWIMTNYSLKQRKTQLRRLILQ